jgi:AcrR family transcriptional regulator
MCAKKSTDQKILDTALWLFNQHHCSQVSLRSIASEMGISDGNLRYHFQTKETIILALFQRMLALMNVEIFDATAPSLLALKNGIDKVFDIMISFRFFFDESVYLRETFPNYSILLNQLQQSRKAVFMDVFDALIQQKEFKGYSNEQYEMLFEQLFIISDNWLSYVPLQTSALELQEAKEHYVNVAFSLFTPYRS